MVDTSKVSQLCSDIKLQEEVITKVLKFILTFDFELINDIMENLMYHKTGFQAYEQLEKFFCGDRTKILATYLICATKVREKYQKFQIDDQIFIATMGCFVRFINECKEKEGVYEFDRAYWTYRQLSMVVFRLGELEYEFKDIDETKFIKIHIPSDSKFTKENVDDSLIKLRNFIDQYFNEYKNCEIVCDSWLLSRKLEKLLDKDSNILNFQKRFNIVKQNYEARDFIQWLFQTNINADISSLKENTSLQKKVKKLLLEGDNIGSGYGVLK